MGDLGTSNIEEAVLEVENLLVKAGKLFRGDRLVMTAGAPFSERRATNMVRIDVVE